MQQRSRQHRVFLVDDDRHYARLISYRLSQHSELAVEVFHSGEAMLERLEEGPEVILLDIMMPGMSGIEVLRQVKQALPDVPVIMVSAQGALNVAIEAMKLGAYDYLVKGQDDLSKLETTVKNALQAYALQNEVRRLREELPQHYRFEEIVGESEPMQQVFRLVQKAARSEITVLIHGESGTGKELVARAIHYNSARRNGPFVVVNCAAIPKELVESEFFGHEKGAFTGAYARKIGKFEQAHGGSIFLDEIGEMEPALQVKLLRVLQNREIQRVGGHETIHVDVRIIAATNRNLREAMHKGEFREDLYYRLFSFPIYLPPLRERGQDVLLLARHFLKQALREHPEGPKKFSREALQAIARHTWPGNVRELKNAIERAVLMAEGPEITAADLFLEAHEPKPVSNGEASGVPLRSGSVIREIVPLEEIKRQAVIHAFESCGRNVDRAAVELGIGRATMYRLLKKYRVLSS
ncbi:MAG: sigma-54 dependent transcriptional regulator [Bacteroidetes bacterium]|nr:sigma-54 dependent transcriptional regulator [Rhodothermia bacterium]MCS7154832.1 sigma-54 dependent transcriptional regulator [Bacteroidota bacterium]MCX7907010.1 sigma-54 dependent transcriptional regulator [Bacteroidota bacterium]MDW8137626.1 sigma-54 dependent transcriptional regulator [Bacteroidota bacterium]MDW8285420.1 sigma-54 dependent transcriptional regulator [Bacteroidota bacterium]